MYARGDGSWRVAAMHVNDKPLRVGGAIGKWAAKRICHEMAKQNSPGL
jgi:hypothetical protein